MKKISFFAALLLCLCSFSCKKSRGIPLDESEPLALAPDISWAVVIDPYAAFRKNCDWSAEVTGQCRKADVLLVEGKQISPDGIWYRFTDGWLPDSSVYVYANRLRAQNVADGLK